MESTTATGLIVEHRAPARSVPNMNALADVPPGTVGPHAGDGDIMIVPPVQPWAGWPTDWQTPNWYGRVATLTDTAWACLDLNSSLLSTMPPYFVGPVPPIDWIDNPDPWLYTSWNEFAKQLVWDYQLGEAFVLATARYEDTGLPARFHVVPPWYVNVESSGTGLRRYSIGERDVTADMLHVRYQSVVGDAHGHGPLEAGSARLVAASALARYASTLAASGGVPYAVLTHPASLNAQQALDLQTHWVQSRMSSMGLPAVLSGGLDFKTLSLSPKDLALIELAQFNESRIAVLLGVPPFIMGLPSGGDSLTYSNVTSLFDYHWRAGLRPKATAVMTALSQWALPPGVTIELNRDEYVRPGPYERAQTWQILVQLGVLSTDEVREIERYSKSAPSQTLTAGVLQ